jgi:hypothetical protein
MADRWLEYCKPKMDAAHEKDVVFAAGQIPRIMTSLGEFVGYAKLVSLVKKLVEEKPDKVKTIVFMESVPDRTFLKNRKLYLKMSMIGVDEDVLQTLVRKTVRTALASDDAETMKTVVLILCNVLGKGMDASTSEAWEVAYAGIKELEVADQHKLVMGIATGFNEETERTRYSPEFPDEFAVMDVLCQIINNVKNPEYELRGELWILSMNDLLPERLRNVAGKAAGKTIETVVWSGEAGRA